MRRGSMGAAAALVLALVLVGCAAKTKEPKAAPKTDSAAAGTASAQEDGQQAENGLISEDSAKEIALKDAGLTEKEISGMRAKLDSDDGVQEYEVEFYAGSKEYDYEIDAVSGTIRNKTMEIDEDLPGQDASAISEDEARKIVLERVPEAPKEDVWLTLEEEDGKIVYEGSVVYNETEYEFEIDASNGRVLEWKEEPVHD